MVVRETKSRKEFHEGHNFSLFGVAAFRINFNHFLLNVVNNLLNFIIVLKGLKLT